MRNLMLIMGVTVIVLSMAGTAHAVLLGPSSYSSFADSPFSSEPAMYLEDFEDHLL